eukprot:TRINITY_DN6390_c0_g1_i1.p1 TRINITY_DN6390_c0_g1~~TRINITY_DN6390_c0_g1_i1.p1  ORF type:complete len:292 (+),score=59.48 TRINITY_DN6390_c0_g1_i1:91-966(+)
MAQDSIVCSVHGKPRSFKSLMDDGEGGMKCAPGFECKVKGTPAASSQEGTAVCATHGKNRSLDSLVEDGWGGMVCAPGKECKVSGGVRDSQASAPSRSSTPNFKRKICAFWQEGRCTKGRDCTYAHGEDDSGGSPDDGFGGKGWLGEVAGLVTGISNALKGTGKLDKLGSKGVGKMAAMLAAKGYRGPPGKGDRYGDYGPIRGGKGGAGPPKGPKPPALGDTKICCIHNKTRSLNALADNGDGTFSCKPNMECKQGAVTAKSSAPAPPVHDVSEEIDGSKGQGKAVRSAPY